MRIRAFLDKASRIKDGMLHQGITPGEQYFVLGIDHDYYRVIDDFGEPVLYPKELFEVLDRTIPPGWRFDEHDDDLGYYYLDPIRTSRSGFYEVFFGTSGDKAARARNHVIVREVLETALATAGDEERTLIRRDAERLVLLRGGSRRMGSEKSVLAFLERSGGEWLVADCAADAVERFRRMDHHVVRVNGRRGLLITYHLWWEEPPMPPPRVYVLFQHVAGHPTAPDDLQRAVEALAFRSAG
jgi:hypothetical protein